MNGISNINTKILSQNLVFCYGSAIHSRGNSNSKIPLICHSIYNLKDIKISPFITFYSKLLLSVTYRVIIKNFVSICASVVRSVKPIDMRFQMQLFGGMRSKLNSNTVALMNCRAAIVTIVTLGNNDQRKNNCCYFSNLFINCK